MTTTTIPVPASAPVMPDGWPPSVAERLDIAAAIMKRRGLNKTGSTGIDREGPICLWMSVVLAYGCEYGEGHFYRALRCLTDALGGDHWPRWSKCPDTTTADAVAMLRRAAQLARGDVSRPQPARAVGEPAHAV